MDRDHAVQLRLTLEMTEQALHILPPIRLKIRSFLVQLMQSTWL